MKKLLIIGAALALPGCAAALPIALDSAVSILKPAAPIGDKVVLEGTRGLIIAHNGYQAAARLAAAFIRSDRATPAQVDAIEKADAQVYYYLNGAGRALPIAERTAAIINAQNDVLVALGQ
jgi:hypothetical protein